MSLDNSLMIEIYPYGGFLAYLKYHFIDGIAKQSVMLLDKTRVDYDSKDAGDKKAKSQIIEPPTIEDKDLDNALLRFGIGKKPTEKEIAEKIRNEIDTK